MVGGGLRACRGAFMTVVMSLFAVMIWTPENQLLCYWVWDVLILPWNEAKLRLEFLVLITFFGALVLVFLHLKATSRAQIIAITGGLSACVATLIACGVSCLGAMVGTPETPWLYYWVYDVLGLPWKEAQPYFESLALTVLFVGLGALKVLKSSRCTQCEVSMSSRCEACDVPKTFNDWQEATKGGSNVGNLDLDDLDTASTAAPSSATSSPTSSPMFAPMSLASRCLPKLPLIGMPTSAIDISIL